MTTETILTVYDIDDVVDLLYGTIATAQKLQFARSIEQAVLQSPEIQALREDAKRWQPIETAPKDGTFILAVNAAIQGRQYVVRYSERYGDHAPWVTGGAPMDFVSGVTHWMPLPPMPYNAAMEQQP